MYNSWWFLALLFLLTFNLNAILLGIASLGLVAIYPFAKRFTWWPQVFLGLAFNWGALLAWAAHAGSLGWPPVLLYLSGIAWTLWNRGRQTARFHWIRKAYDAVPGLDVPEAFVTSDAAAEPIAAPA